MRFPLILHRSWTLPIVPGGKREILDQTWDRIDFKENIVRLEADETKNSEGRTIYLDSALREVLLGQKRNRRLGCPYVFHRDGERIQGFRKAWSQGCKKTGFDWAALP